MGTLIIHFVGGPDDGGFRRCSSDQFKEGMRVVVKRKKIQLKCRYVYKSKIDYYFDKDHISVYLTDIIMPTNTK